MKAKKAARLTLSHRQAQYIIESAKAFAEDAGREISPEELLSRMLSRDHLMAVGCAMVRETVVFRENPDPPLFPLRSSPSEVPGVVHAQSGRKRTPAEKRAH